MGTLLGLGYKGGVGKDTVGDYLVKEYGFIKKSFADNLKQGCHKIFGIELGDMYDQEKKASLFASPIIYTSEAHKAVLEWMMKSVSGFCPDSFVIPTSIKDKQLWSIREVLQFVGSDIMRKYISDYHILTCLSDLDELKNYVVCDCRFPNEVDAILSSRGFCIRLDRETLIKEGSLSSHISETALDSWDHWSYVVDNREDGLDKLYGKITTLIEEIRNGG